MCSSKAAIVLDMCRQGSKLQTLPDGGAARFWSFSHVADGCRWMQTVCTMNLVQVRLGSHRTMCLQALMQSCLHLLFTSTHAPVI